MMLWSYLKKLETHESEFMSLFKSVYKSMLDDLMMRHWENAWQLNDKWVNELLYSKNCFSMKTIVFNFKLQSKCLLHIMHWNFYIHKIKLLVLIFKKSQIRT
jgi:hypothetical protein